MVRDLAVIVPCGCGARRSSLESSWMFSMSSSWRTAALAAIPEVKVAEQEITSIAEELQWSTSFNKAFLQNILARVLSLRTNSLG